MTWKNDYGLLSKKTQVTPRKPIGYDQNSIEKKVRKKTDQTVSGYIYVSGGGDDILYCFPSVQSFQKYLLSYVLICTI